MPFSFRFLLASFLILFIYPLTDIQGQTTDNYTSVGSGTWTAPACVTTVTVSVWGGGGADRLNGGDAGAGGGGGAYSYSVLTVVPGTTYTLSVGGGGTGGVGDGDPGDDGGNSWFSLNGIAPVSNATGTLAEGEKEEYLVIRGLKMLLAVVELLDLPRMVTAAQSIQEVKEAERKMVAAAEAVLVVDLQAMVVMV